MYIQGFTNVIYIFHNVMDETLGQRKSGMTTFMSLCQRLTLRSGS